jgi:hypothetical protein
MPIASALTIISASSKARVTPTAIASILVPIAVTTRTPNACCRGFFSPFGLRMLSHIIFAPIAARRPNAIQWSNAAI